MIEVVLRHVESGVELARIDIERLDSDEDESDYSIRFGVDRIKAVGIHQRGIHRFPRNRYNVLALLLQALSTLEERDLELDHPVDQAPGRRKKLSWRYR